MALREVPKVCCAGDQHGNIRVWDLTANACSCELVPEVGTAVRSLTVALDGSLVVAANNQGVNVISALAWAKPFASHVHLGRSQTRDTWLNW